MKQLSLSIKVRSILIVVAVFIFLLTVSFGFWIKSTGALLGFGGRVISVIPCTCGPVPGSITVVVGVPSPGNLLYIPGVSTLFSYYQIYRPGAYVLGTYAPSGAVCMVGIPPGCISSIPPPFGTITSAGTSL